MNKEFSFTREQLLACQDKIIGAFGLAMRAGKCIVGADMCVECIRNGTAKLVIAAGDLSENTQKKLKDSCSFHSVDILFLALTKMELGARLGKNAGTACACVVDDGFVNICRKIYLEIQRESMEVQQ